MKKKQLIYKSIAGILVIVLLIGIVRIGEGLSRTLPAELPYQNAMDITPEAARTIPEQPDDLEENDTDEMTEQPDENEQEEVKPEGAEPDKTETVPDENGQGDTEQGKNNAEGTENTSKGDSQPGNDAEVGGNPGGNGEPDDKGQGDTVTETGPEDDSKLQLVTNLHNGQITYDELENDILSFYAYLMNGDGMTLRVKLRNSSTLANGKYLTADGKNYQAQLCREEANYFTFYVKDGATIVQEVTYTIRYVAQKADAEHPTVGDNPPTVVTNLEGVTELSNRNFTFIVKATAYTGRTIYSSNIEVRMDGQRVTNPTGGPEYEYQLYFPDPEEGDSTKHKITVLAWDEKGNSTYVVYNLTYQFVDTGDVIGSAYVILDMTTVGLGIMFEPFVYEVKQNEPAAYAVLAMLDEYGFGYDYAGSEDENFYLRRISMPGLMDYPAIPDNLWQKIQQDGLTLTNQSYSDSLGEFDFVQGSGWMYSVGGVTYAGKGLSEYCLSDGDTLYLRYTLAYGKDIGGYSSTGGAYGLLNSYCGKWINDTYIDQHEWSEQIITKEATCTEAGEMSCVCAICKDTKDSVIIEPTGHSFQEISRTDPVDGKNGVILYQCEYCKEEKEEVIAWKEPETESGTPSEGDSESGSETPPEGK